MANDKVVQLHKTDFQKQVELALECGVESALIMWLDDEGLCQYLAPPNTSVYELGGMCAAVQIDLLTG
jgi:hypothetical protein